MIKKVLKKCSYEVKQPLKFLYYSLPVGFRYGKVYRDTIKLLESSQWWTEQQHLDYQMQQLQKLLNYSYQNVPYYRQLFNECGFNPHNFKYFDELKQIPYLTKEIIRDNLEKIVSTKYNKSKLGYITTGGSTGIPLGFYVNEKYYDACEWAFITNQWGRIGFSNNSKVAVLRGNLIHKNLVELNGRQLILSSYHLTDQNMEMYVKRLRQFKPEFFHVYPSAIFQLADFMLKNRIEPISSIKAVLAASENVYQYQKDTVERAFNCRMFSFYGHSERSVLAGECEKSDNYHIYSEYGYTEIVRENGSNVVNEDELGEVIATGFINYVTPFIRYKTADLAVNTNHKCECGRNYKLIKKIEGRLHEFLVTSTGRYISMVAMNMHSDIFDHVRQFQFYQDDPNYCILNLVRKTTYTEHDEQYIYDEVKKKLGNDLELKINYMNEIPKTTSGKCRFLIQKLKVNYGDR